MPKFHTTNPGILGKDTKYYNIEERIADYSEKLCTFAAANIK